MARRRVAEGRRADSTISPAERTRILLALPKILNSLLNISLAHHWLSTSTLIMSLSGRLVQATPRLEAPLAQLPHVDLAAATTAGRADERLREPGWQRAVAGMDADTRGKLDAVIGKEEGALRLDDETSKEVLRRVPLLEVTNVSFKGMFGGPRAWLTSR